VVDAYTLYNMRGLARVVQVRLTWQEWGLLDRAAATRQITLEQLIRDQLGFDQPAQLVERHSRQLSLLSTRMGEADGQSMDGVSGSDDPRHAR
jgi:hypothetical protein